jgi:hypothetical protein
MKEKNGEHPFGDSGQLVLLVAFLIVWVADSFFLRISTFLSDDISLLIRLVILSFALIAEEILSMMVFSYTLIEGKKLD